MTKFRFSFPIIYLLVSISCAAQSQLIRLIQDGAYGVGYFDTIIHTEVKSYREFEYRGMEPMFVKVWHPIEKNSRTDFLSFQAFHYPDIYSHYKNPKYKIVSDQLIALTDTIIKQNLLSEELFTWEPLHVGTLTAEGVLDSLLQMQTNSVYQRLTKKSRFPVIVYHHGSRGSADENSIMAEFFASRGYIFVAANFHLPYEKMIFGLTETTNNQDVQIKRLISYAEDLTRSNTHFYVGHSWGAQVGWNTLHEKNPIDAFVSLETTIEFKTDTNEIKDKWPFVYESLVKKENKLDVPVLMIANTGNDKPFPFFMGTTTKRRIEVSAKEEFLHESYTSLYLMRYFLQPELHQPDSAALANQLMLYEQHLLLMHAYLENYKRKKWDWQKFNDHFFIARRA